MRKLSEAQIRGLRAIAEGRAGWNAGSPAGIFDPSRWWGIHAGTAEALVRLGYLLRRSKEPLTPAGREALSKALGA